MIPEKNKWYWIDYQSNDERNFTGKAFCTGEKEANAAGITCWHFITYTDNDPFSSRITKDWFFLEEEIKNEIVNPIHLEKLKKLINGERDHQEADDILCDILRELGYTEIAEAYDNVGKWYS